MVNHVISKMFDNLYFWLDIKQFRVHFISVKDLISESNSNSRYCSKVDLRNSSLFLIWWDNVCSIYIDISEYPWWASLCVLRFTFLRRWTQYLSYVVELRVEWQEYQERKNTNVYIRCFQNPNLVICTSTTNMIYNLYIHHTITLNIIFSTLFL